MKFFIFIFLLAFADQSAEANCDQGSLAFQRSLYPLLVKNCAQCHGDTGEETGHAVSDPAQAYGKAVRLVDFINLDRSRFMIKVKQKHWLNYDPDAQGMSETDMKAALQAWWLDGENTCPMPFGFTSLPLAVPLDIPDRPSGNFRELLFSLAEFNASLAGCQIKLKVQQFTKTAGEVPGSYRVTSPEVLCSKPIKMTRLRVLVNGETQAFENIYDEVNMSVLPSSDWQMISTKSMILIERPGANQLAIAIGELTL